MSVVSSTIRGRGDRRSALGSWGGDESVSISGDVAGESEKIHVAIRLRPLNDKEMVKNDVSDWECISATTLIFKSSMPDRSMLPSAFTFDRVFGPDSGTKQVYEEVAKEVALSVVSGVNASIFAYGQTSSGKTYTMSGITEYAMADIFNYIYQNQEREFVLKFSAIEIYNEAVRDLLSSDPSPLRLLDDPERGTIIDKLIEETVEDWNHLQELLSICEGKKHDSSQEHCDEIEMQLDFNAEVRFSCGAAQRHIGETALNEFSSRSHQILRLTVESCARENFGSGNLSTLTASLNFVDLAGSERASQAWSTGTRLKEGSHINRSLLTLGTVIRKLSKGKYGHIPYRESKLTRILQNCLGGNAKTAIICTMSPARCHAEQSRNTLMFASCAKEVSTSAQVNVVMTDKALVKQLQREISRLEGQLERQAKNSLVGTMSKANDTAALLKEKDLLIEQALVKQLQGKISRMEGQLERQAKNSLVGTMSKASDTAALLKEKDLLIEQLQKDISRLEGQLELQANSLVGTMSIANDTAALLKEKELLLEQMEQEIKELTWQRDLAQSHIDSLLKSVREDRLFRVDENSVLEADAVLARSSSTGREYDQFSMPNLVPKRQLLETQASLGANSLQEEIPQRSTSESENMCRDVPCAEMGETPSTKMDNTTDEPADVTLATAEETKELCDVGSYDIHEILKRRVQELQKTIESLDKSSPYRSEKGVSWTRSKSKKVVVMTIPSALWSKKAEDKEEDSEEEDGYDARDSSATDEEITERRENPEEDNKGLKMEHVSRMNNSEYPESCVVGTKEDEIIKEIDVHFDDFDDTTSVLNSVAGGKKGKKIIKHQKQPTREIGVISVVEPLRRIPEGRPMTRARDLVSETNRSLSQSQANWSQKFERYRRKIIELWAKCNVPLVHRSYFFLLFKGDPSDNVYMEVELRRLYFMKDTAARGNNPVVDSQVATYTSSSKLLNRERIMLAKQLQKKLTRREREELYLKWNIELDTKQRALQLAGKLWTDLRNIRHVRESSILVVKLIGFVEPQYAPKELFGLSFLNPSANQKSSSWRDNVSSLL
ncbi:unnamed protein product [Linum tenue]|uniref:Kinesin motor domain-containing protein n=1 Tax=Linum tenue TaxID=586396 RepID=A0AAV0HCM7_9ROSI|nr:unnamed protein product [Linum tenue]